ncbi:prepilin peptidase [Bacillus suaedaesalsae]|uniref:Prepilin leader peptidase/N-methyltransferase n=1 Tax=Bacillus suaedaesalsae TaxID=2810349 RepID=A0ABS2DMR9_9BACI|nr:A24 family peptidase [Bacillus suaedaesalsae]MBM6619754.1 prepilin peptidase [Bacillus suaedaesalsae]
MELFYLTYLFIIGLTLGSFYNVVGLRIPQNESISTPRSHCTSCNRTLSSYELIPVFSYIFLRGKCKTCGAKVSPIYPIMELITGLLFLYSGLTLGWSLELLLALSFISMLVIISVSDIAYMIIPDKVLLFFLPFFIILRVLLPTVPWWDSILGAFAGFGLLLLIAIVTKGNGMGFGDVKLSFLIGLVLGFQSVILSFFLAALLGSVIGGVALLTGIVSRKQPIPFGPFIAVSAIICYFFGENIVEWYINWIKLS